MELNWRGCYIHMYGRRGCVIFMNVRERERELLNGTGLRHGHHVSQNLLWPYSFFDKECLRNVNARVFTNQMWTDGRRTKTDPKTSPEQSGKTMTSRVFTKTTAPPSLLAAIHVFQRTGTILGNKLFTRFLYIHIKKTAPPTGGHFHDDWAKIVTSRPNKENCPPTGGHVFQRTRTIFELNQHMIKTNILTNFKLDRGIIRTNLLTKFHEDRTINVASRVLTMKTASPTGGYVFQRSGTTFELNQHIIKTNILTKLHKEWA
ncbi:hypothetical protein DPMN_187891 [Dreissena polymorpha]|uniref:Uncharacterized protein n=1 Tax=Dreissena polymorpha TaxID=45954 RepID=A0A9D4DR26_DREPO|nr:hypothetical protein DPMN_187891 [Dreissena polymorpha]